MSQVNAHVSFCYVWMYLQRNTYTVPHAINISFIITVSSFISVIEMQELVVVNNLSYCNVRNMLHEKNLDAGEISERSVKLFCNSNNMRNQSNLSKEEFQEIIFLQASKVWHLKCLLFMKIIVFQKGFGKDHPGYSAFWITLLSL